MKVRSRLWLAACAGVLAVACLSKLKGVPSLGQDAGAEVPSCGARGSACCEPSPSPCEAGLECDGASTLCVRPPTRLCASDEECPAEQVCCVTGLIGTCASSSVECPELDLAISTAVIDPLFPLLERGEGLDDIADQCAYDRGCIGGPGLRTLLRFTTQVQNVGAADLLLGDPARTAGFATATCDGLPYLEDFILYQLVDENGDVRAESHAPALCPPSPSVTFTSPFDCDFLGLWSGFSQLYAPETVIPSESDESTVSYRETPCQWLDITDLPPGRYALRTTIDPRGVLQERNRANNTPPDLPVEIPRFGDPTVPCGDPPNPLYGVGGGRDCDLIREESASGTCTPDDSPPFYCEGCGAYRVCDREQACTSGESIASGEGCFSGEENSFYCQEGGRFSFWYLNDESSEPLRCTFGDTNPVDAGTNATP